jgi:murein DD-endopeptidase MepM/ murein hydrolase activator NlpD
MDLKMKEVPTAGKSRFTEFLKRENRLDRCGFEAWAFWPGMLFRAAVTWWGDREKRAVPHEGVDFCLYADRRGRVLCLEEGIRVPVMYDGVIIRIIDDFLGKSVLAAHGLSGADRTPFLTVYGHTVPRPDLAVGAAVTAGDVIATIAGAGGSKGAVHPHLHVSMGHTSGLVPYERLEWGNMKAALAFANPLDVIDGPYRMLEQEGP